MIPLLEAECAKEAQARSVTLPPDWSALAVVDKLREAMTDVQPAVLKAVAKLRDDGTCCPYPPPGGQPTSLVACWHCKNQKSFEPRIPAYQSNKHNLHHLVHPQDREWIKRK